MRSEKHTVNGKEYDLIIEPNGLGGKVTPTYRDKRLGITYSVSLEIAHDFQFSSSIGSNALDELVKIAKDDLDRGVVAG